MVNRNANGVRPTPLALELNNQISSPMTNSILKQAGLKKFKR